MDAADLTLIGQLEGHIAQAEARLAEPLPATEFAVLTTVNGWATVLASDYARRLAARSKHSATITCALANRANRIAFALVRDQTAYDPTRWR